MSFKLGIIGLGKIAQDQHLPCVAKNRDFELAAVVSSRRPHMNVPSFKTPEELFASGIRLDAVSLCMPPGPRFAIARQALDAGLHLLLEKPPTPTMGELVALIDYAATRKRILFTTWHSQYNAAVNEAKRLLAGKTVAKLHVSWKEDVRHWHPGQEWIWEPGGFGVFDPGINAFSIVTKIMPQPIFVAASVLEVPSNRATPIAARIRFKPSQGGPALMTAELDWRQTGEQSWNIDVETEDDLRLALRKGGTELYLDGALKLAAPSQEYEAIYAHFAELLKTGRSHIDPAPLQLVSDCLMLGRQVAGATFV
ncbi:MAG: Gfo/Idh/MocA family oxidoreductase [Rhizobiales bacterium]|nr:Gfo/Idh/MocA family oxidoreductase [Hyphomicrobiales bacterium]MBI3672057.1 Gfo/Idh/MocA family oxidoreductase [Hyphomicrobiales bacterium]